MDFYKVDVDEVTAVASQLGVRAMPTFYFFRKGEKVDEVVGANPSALKVCLYYPQTLVLFHMSWYFHCLVR